MAKFPNTVDWSGISSRPFSKYAKSIEKMGVARFPLHIGDTHLPPPKSAEVTSLSHKADSRIHKYCSPGGLPELLSVISNEYQVSEKQIMIVPGATGGLHLSAMTTLSPGDEVLILAPFWPLAAGIIQAVGATPISVPFFGVEGSVVDRLAPYLTNQTAAIYCNSPNNPSGAMLSSSEAEELADIVRKKELWLYADEVYERLVYTGRHIPMRHLAPNHTISLFSFSKAYAMAGYRCGYVLLPNERYSDMFLKGAVHSFYSVPTPAQILATKVLLHEQDWIENTRQQYAKAGAAVADILGVAHPSNGTFIFMDISQYISSRTFDDFMEACIAEKLLLAPGSAFGTGYENYIRICFTAADEQTVIDGAGILRDILSH